ncbi:hypothetical protein HK405_001765, partial [Cladochytrium tenue]
MSTTSATLKPDTLVGGGQDNLLDDIEQRLRNFQPAVAIEKQELFGAVVASVFNALRKREKAAAERVAIIEKSAAASEKTAAERVALIEKIAAEKVALSETAVAASENAAAAREKAAVKLVALSEKAVAANEATIAAIKVANAKEVEFLEQDLRITRNQLLYLERKLTGRYIIKKFEEANEIDVKKNTREEAWKEFLDKIEGTE